MADAGVVAAIVEGNSTFASRMFQQLAQDGGNVFYSPYSVSTAMAMAAVGAQGTTATQMAQVLDLPAVDDQTLADGFGALGCALQTDGNADGGQLNQANALFGQQGVSFEQPFLTDLQSGFDSPLRPLDFMTQPAAAEQTIDAWVSEQTAGKIADLLAPGDITPATRFVLVDALYLSQQWAQPFDPMATTMQPFQTPVPETVVVPMMSGTVQAGYYSAPPGACATCQPLQIVELPFADSSLAVDLFLPQDLQLLLYAITPAILSQEFSAMTQEQVHLNMPKLQLDLTENLIPAFEQLGLTLPFGPDANFSGIDGAMDFSIGLVKHEAVLQLDESGVVAAAATAVVGTTSGVVSAQVTVTFNQPYMIVIRDRTTGTILFMGQVVDPIPGVAIPDPG